MDNNTREIQEIMLKEKISKNIVRYINQNENAIINIINATIMKEKDIIETYEAMMFYKEYWSKDGIPHYEYDTTNNGPYPVLIKKGKINLDKKMRDVFENEYVEMKNKSYFRLDVLCDKTYNQDFHCYARDLVFKIQDKILLDIVKLKVPNADFLGEELVYECRFAIDQKTIAYKFHLNSNAFGSYRDTTLKEYIELGKKYMDLYSKDKHAINEYDFLKTLFAKENP